MEWGLCWQMSPRIPPALTVSCVCSLSTADTTCTWLHVHSIVCPDVSTGVSCLWHFISLPTFSFSFPPSFTFPSFLPLLSLRGQRCRRVGFYFIFCDWWLKTTANNWWACVSMLFIMVGLCACVHMCMFSLPSSLPPCHSPSLLGSEVKGAGEISSPVTDFSKQQQLTTCTGECVHVYLYAGVFVAGLDLCVCIPLWWKMCINLN